MTESSESPKVQEQTIKVEFLETGTYEESKPNFETTAITVSHFSLPFEFQKNNNILKCAG